MLTAYILCCLLLFGTVWAQSGILSCSQLGLRIRSSRASVHPGNSIVLAAKVVNTGTRTVSGIGVRLDLPTGLATQAKSLVAPLVENGGTIAYWTELTLRSGKRRVLKLKARACGSATPGSFVLGGAVYLVNATNGVTCLSSATTTNRAVVCTWSEKKRLTLHTYIFDPHHPHIAHPLAFVPPEIRSASRRSGPRCRQQGPGLPHAGPGAR